MTVHRLDRTVALFMCALLVIASVVTAAEANAAAEAEPAEDAQALASLKAVLEVRARIDVLAEQVQKGLIDEQDPKLVAASREFNAGLQAAASLFIPVPVTINKSGNQPLPLDPDQLTHVILNTRNIGINAVRFTAPARFEAYNLRWVFIVPGTHSSWYIAPLEGEMQGFRNFKFQRNHPVDLPGIPEKNLSVQQNLFGGEIRGGQDYLIWFTFPADQAFETHLWIDLESIGDPVQVEPGVV